MKNNRKDRVWSIKSICDIRTGKKWTLLSTECYLRNSCKKCVYLKYCKKNKINNIPIIKMVISKLISEVGEPPRDLIDKVFNY